MDIISEEETTKQNNIHSVHFKSIRKSVDYSVNGKSTKRSKKFKSKTVYRTKDTLRTISTTTTK